MKCEYECLPSAYSQNQQERWWLYSGQNAIPGRMVVVGVVGGGYCAAAVVVDIPVAGAVDTLTMMREHAPSKDRDKIDDFAVLAAVASAVVASAVVAFEVVESSCEEQRQ